MPLNIVPAPIPEGSRRFYVKHAETGVPYAALGIPREDGSELRVRERMWQTDPEAAAHNPIPDEDVEIEMEI